MIVTARNATHCLSPFSSVNPHHPSSHHPRRPLLRLYLAIFSLFGICNRPASSSTRPLRHRLKTQRDELQRACKPIQSKRPELLITLSHRPDSPLSNQQSRSDSSSVCLPISSPKQTDRFSFLLDPVRYFQRFTTFCISSRFVYLSLRLPPRSCPSFFSHPLWPRAAFRLQLQLQFQFQLVRLRAFSLSTLDASGSLNFRQASISTSKLVWASTSFRNIHHCALASFYIAFCIPLLDPLLAPFLPFSTCH